MAITTQLFDFTQVLNMTEVVNATSGAGSMTNVTESIVYQVPFSLENSFVATMLGWSYTVPATGSQAAQLKRNNPKQHPRLPQLRASSYDVVRRIKPVTSISQQGYTYNSPNGQPGGRTAVAPLTAPNANQVPFYLNYQYSEIRIDFTLPTQNYKEDVQMVSEWQRNMTFSTRSESSFISREGAQYKFSTGPAAGNPLPGSISILEAKTTISATWEVPESWVCGSLHPKMPKIQAAVGRVNLYSFFNYQPGELLLDDAPDGDREAYNVYDDSGDQVFFRRIPLVIKAFTPNYGSGTFNMWGHQTAANPGDNLYYPYTADGSNPAAGSSKYKYPSIDFSTIFSQASS